MKPKGRCSTTSAKTNTSAAHFACRFSAAIVAFMQLPAFISCSQSGFQEESPNIIRIRTSEGSDAALDVFCFYEDPPQRLESYQQLSGEDRIITGPDALHVIALSGKKGDFYANADVSVPEDLARKTVKLEEEDIARPRLYGETHVGPGRSRTALLELKPSICKIRFRFVSCDFSGTAYPNLACHGTRLFIINAASECSPLAAGNEYPVSWLNMGALTSAHPYVNREISCALGSSAKDMDTLLYCYANPAESDTPGRPLTRAVLEVMAGERTCYYPVNLPSMNPGSSYVIDMKLLRLGTSDPDIPAESSSAEISVNSLPWKNLAPVTESF